MKIEKIKNYNQRLLAVLGTVVVLMALLGLVSIATLMYNELSRSWRNNQPEEGILSDEKIQELQEENKRQQLISYENPILIDTNNLIYIVPVSQKTLKSAEEIEEDVRGISDFESEALSVRLGGKGRYYSQLNGTFNNFLVYDFKLNSIKKLFDQRVYIENMHTEYFEDEILLLFETSEKDTYKDGRVDSKDLTVLYIYSFNDQQLRKIEQPQSTISRYRFVLNSKNLLVQFGMDHNENGQFDSSREPQSIMFYDYQSGQLSEIVPKEVSSNLQRMLEGTTKK